MASSSGLDKFSRIAQLVEWGFNAPLYHKISTMYELDRRVILSNWSRVSVRFQGSVSSGKKTPVFINADPNDYDFRFYLFNAMVDYGDAMISKGMPIAEYWSGCIEVEDDGDFLLESVAGVSVRELTHGNKTPDISIRGNIHSDLWRYHVESMLVDIIAEVSVLKPSGHMIFEFSCFGDSQGWKNERNLFWEYEEINNGHTEHLGRKLRLS